MFKIGDSVVVRKDIEIVEEPDYYFIGKKAKISNIDSWLFPVEVEFEDKETQSIYEGLGKRRFDFCELVKVD
jgi:hypothetical protein